MKFLEENIPVNLCDLGKDIFLKHDIKSTHNKS